MAQTSGATTEAVPAPPPGGLTDAALKQMLLDMGYEPKGLSKGFLIAPKRGTWTINIQLVLSKDQSKIGLNANLGKVPNPETIPAASWLKLLVDNGNIDPSSFYFDKDQKKLYLHRVMDNRAVTPAVLRSQIENFSENVRDTNADWKFTD